MRRHCFDLPCFELGRKWKESDIFFCLLTPTLRQLVLKGSVIFYQEGEAPENWGWDQVLCLRSKDFFKLKRGDHLYFLKK